MPVETSGEFGTPGANREWLSAQATLAIRHIVRTCGPPPQEMELEVQWQDHELGSYPLIVLTWEDAMRGAPGKYLSKCEAALLKIWNSAAICSSGIPDLRNAFIWPGKNFANPPLIAYNCLPRGSPSPSHGITSFTVQQPG